MISIVIPVLNEEKGIQSNINTIIENIPCEYEVVIVDDGSTDTTWEKIKELSNNNSNIRGIRFSRNFRKRSGFDGWN